MSKETLTIFYSWQSDLPKETCQNAIRSSIKSSIIPIEEDNDTLNIVLDEATRNKTGSPDIPSSIFDKISRADIFICDITTINQTESSTRKTPNPNVLIELGYAISILGWERIIMIFNKNFGDFQKELPFDLNKRRVTPFSIKDKSDKSGKNNLTAKLKEGIESIVKDNPLKPNEKEQKTDEQIKREKDIANIKILMSCIHIQTFDFFLDELPDRVVGRIFYFWYSFEGNYESNTFHIYDKELRDKISTFKNSWGKTLSFGHIFTNSTNWEDFVIHAPMDLFPHEKNEKSYKELTKETARLKSHFKGLIIYLRENYLEVDINELSEQAKQDYNNYREL